LEEALIDRMQSFLLELGDDFAFVGRQRRLRIDNQWYRVDLIFFHRRLRALVLIDLKTGDFSAEHVGRMNLYVNYAKKHWTREDEGPPLGLILCAKGSSAVAEYAFAGITNRMMAASYTTMLPDLKQIESEMVRATLVIEERLRRAKRERDGDMVRDQARRAS